ncbi:phage/plasmid primase, P4 family [Haloplanus pelagicus]|uniref:phage/plasmid primase, P4 family n=1 Tax=Haloplanus pelagicus TaxID=2949995 RepID=UPI002040E4BE|nr:phage/plasmid primase, P4 family [Haloplanus sp. HW8-1]
MSDDRPPRPTPLAFSPDPIPDELRRREQWVAWRYEWDADRDEWTKVPVDVDTGRYASSMDSDTWASFEDAVAYHDRDGIDTDGVGFVVSDDDLLVGIDLDDCRAPDTAAFEPWAEELVDDVPTYAEVSPSGTGLRLFAFGFVPDGGSRDDVDGAEGHLEMYDSGRYLTVTGHALDDAPADVRQVNDEISEVHAEYIADGQADAEATTPASDGGVQADTPAPNPGLEAGGSGSGDGPDALSDDELLRRAKRADNGEKFARLWNGDTSAHPSHSEADLALCSMLAFWTAGDRGRIERLFRRSGLCRDKWTEREDYRRRTIDTALDGVSDAYDPDRDNGGDVSTALPNDPTPPEGAVSDDGTGTELRPTTVKAQASLGEDGQVSDLNDREKAACVWDLLKHSDRYHVRVRRDNGSLWAYDDGVWTATGERALRHAGRQALGSMNYGSNVLGELKAQARGDPVAEVAADDFGVQPGTVAVENGLLDLDAAAENHGTDALRDLRPDDYALAQLPVEYDPTATYDEWADYVDEWAEDGRADALQEYVGYCLHVGAMPIHRALLLVGSGANGKGTFLSVVRALLGRENTSSIELQTLANESDAVADFYGSVANIDDDLSARKLGAGLGMFKKLVAGDRVRARRLYENGFEFDATGKHLYAANEVPDVNVPDEDEAFWRRWLLVEFPNHYPPNDRDPTLRDELTTDDALSGVLNWAIAGWKRLLEQGHFTNEDHHAHAKRERWQAWGDSVEQFVSECVEHDPDAPRLTTRQAHRRYTAWCRANGEEPVGQQKFTNTLKNEDVGYGRHRIEGKSQRGYKALGLSDDVPDPDDGPDGGQTNLT